MICPSAYPPQEEYLLEQLLRNVTSVASAALSSTSGALSRTIYVIPNGEYTGPFLAALQEAGFAHQLMEPGAVDYQATNDQNGHYPVADLQQALNSRRWKKPLAEIVQETKEYALGRDKIVRVIPSEKTPLLLEALEKEGVPYYIAQPKSFFKPEQEYEINLPELELEMER